MTLDNAERYEVYVLLDSENEIRYVGCTKNPRQRKVAHLYSFDKKDLVYETYDIYKDGASAREAERELIISLTLAGSSLLNHMGLEILDEIDYRRRNLKSGKSNFNLYSKRLRNILEAGERQNFNLEEIYLALLELILKKLEDQIKNSKI